MGEWKWKDIDHRWKEGMKEGRKEGRKAGTEKREGKGKEGRKRKWNGRRVE